MSWQQRLREAAYTSPSGRRMTFAYEDVAKDFDKKTAAFELIDVDQTFVQDNGPTGRRFPLRIFFSGDNYDLEAAQFEELLRETGRGVLEHPAYGRRDVVPFGRVAQRDDLKTGGNQAIVETAFYETAIELFPLAATSPAAATALAVSEANAAAGTTLADTAELDAAVDQVEFRERYERVLRDAEAALRPLAATVDAVANRFDAIRRSIDAGIDALVADPLTLAAQTVALIQAPARATAAIADRLQAYRDLADRLISGDAATVPSEPTRRDANAFHGNELFAFGYVTASVVSVINHRFETKPEALTAADAILTLFEDVVAWAEAGYAALGAVDRGGQYQQVLEAVSIAVGFLVQISFSLQQERSVVLDRARTIVDLAAELYGSVDDRLDFLINSNNLSGAEVLELPRGKRIVYYA